MLGLSFPAGAVVKNLPASVGDSRDTILIPVLGKIPWKRQWQPTPVFLPREFHGQRTLACYSPWGCKESDTTEQLTLHFQVPKRKKKSYMSSTATGTGHGSQGLPRQLRGRERARQCRRWERLGFDPRVGKIPWRRAWQLTPVFLPGESHGQRSLVGHSPWGHKKIWT